MKRLLSIILSLVLLLSLVCGCGDKGEKGKTESTAVTSSSDTQSTENTSSDDTASSEDETSADNSGNNEITRTVIQTVPQNTVLPTTSSDNVGEDVSEGEEEEKSLRDTLQGGINFSAMDSGGTAVKNSKSYIYDRKYYDLVAEAGFDHIRLPVGFGSLVVSEAPEYLLDNEALRYIDMAINHALDAGLVLILDNHHNSAYKEKEKFVRIWEQLAERYCYYPEQLMFELVNEPNGTTDSYLNEVELAAVEVIRKTNPTRTVILAPNQWNGSWKLWDCAVPSYLNESGQLERDENVMLSVHIYNTMDFTHQGMDGKAEAHWKDSIATSVTSALEICADYEERTGRTVWISEWGAYQGSHRDGKDGCMQKYYKHFTSECARLDLAYAVWEFNSGFGVFNNTSDEFYSYLLDSMVISW